MKKLDQWKKIGSTGNERTTQREKEREREREGAIELANQTLAGV